jgi:hypothetical protein
MWILHLIVFIVYGALVEYYIFCCVFFKLLLWVVAMRMFKNTILASSIFKVEPSLLRILLGEWVLYPNPLRALAFLGLDLVVEQ